MRTEEEVNDALRLLRREMNAMRDDLGQLGHSPRVQRLNDYVNALMWARGDDASALQFLLDDLRAVHGEADHEGSGTQG